MKELKPRQKEILTFTIDSYIETKSPVGSKVLTQRYPLNLSPASVRHEMGILEGLGYLTHPYTSAGRVPTDKGYRFYAQEAPHREAVPEHLLHFISCKMNRKVDNLESFAERASHLLSTVVQETVLVMVSQLGDRLLSAETPRIFMGGSRYIVSQPEFHDLRKLEKLMAFLEEKTNCINLLTPRFPEEGVHLTSPARGSVYVAIGERDLSPEIWDCAVVTSPYFWQSKQAGAIGVLGPRRMPYGRIVGLVRYMAEKMSRSLEGGWSA